MTYSARSPLDQHRLSCFKTAITEQALPSSLPCKRDGGRVNMVEPGGLRRKGALIYGDLLRVTTAVNIDNAEYLVAYLEASGLGAAGRDDPRNISARRVGKTVVPDARIQA